MDLSVNLTLLVQIANFLVAYVLINRLLSKPGYEVVAADKQQQKQLESSIVARQELIAHKQLYKADRWKLFQDHFHKQKPSVKRVHAEAYPIDDVQMQELSQEQLQRLSTKISTVVQPLVNK